MLALDGPRLHRDGRSALKRQPAATQWRDRRDPVGVSDANAPNGIWVNDSAVNARRRAWSHARCGSFVPRVEEGRVGGALGPGEVDAQQNDDDG